MPSVAVLADERFGPVRISQPVREKILSYLPFSMRSGLVSQFLHIAAERSYREANLRLYEVQRDVVEPDLLRCGDFLLTSTDEAVCDWAEAKAKAVEGANASECEEYAEAVAVELLLPYGFEPIESGDLLGRVERYKDARWWRRQMRRKQAQTLDQLARDLRLVSHRGQIYLSDEAYTVRREAKHRNRALLERLEAENQHGDCYTLAELSDTSVSKPENRRNELMVRMRGFEEVAVKAGHVGEFITITCPSKYHPTTAGRPNPKYQGFTPKQANDYLTYQVWAAIRKELNRLQIGVYGFRVVEPHSDGCPHWHLMLFMPEQHQFIVRRIVKKHAMAVDPTEPGAGKYRCKFVAIDPKKGTAAGYIAKYISKNIDGHAVNEDLYGRDAAVSASRITEWAGTWCIRQFQQIGGAPVTIWRELRRIKDEQFAEWVQTMQAVGVRVPDLAQKARQAADWADWAAYTLLMGGAIMRRADRPIQLCMMTAPETDPLKKINRITGEVVTEQHGKYGDLLTKVRGLLVKGVIVVSRWYSWTVKPIKEGLGFGGLSGANAPPWTRVNNCPVVATG